MVCEVNDVEVDAKCRKLFGKAEAKDRINCRQLAKN